MNIFRNLWQFFNKSIIPFEERLNIIVTFILASVSLILSLVTSNQQQEIKGMSSLLLKQDTQISTQDSINKQLLSLNKKNSEILTELKNSQVYLSKQLTVLQNQKKDNEYSNKPLVDLEGNLKLIKIKDKYRLSFKLKNNGFRKAEKLKIRCYWVDIKNNMVRERIKFSTTINTDYLLPNQSRFQIIEPFPINDLERNELESWYFVLLIQWVDPLNNKKDKFELLCSQEQLPNDEIGLFYTEGKIKDLLKNYIKNK